MSINIGDPDHLGVHNDLTARAASQAARFGVSVTLPDVANVGDTGHVADHNLLAAALDAIANAPNPGTPWATATGGTVTTDGEWTVHTFTTNGDFIVAEAGWVDIMVCGGGAPRDTVNNSPGGGANVRFGGQYLEPGTYAVVVGAGGQYGTQPGSGGNGGRSSFGTIYAAAGGITEFGDFQTQSGWEPMPMYGLSGRGGGGAGGGTTTSTPGPGVVWHGVEYGKGGASGVAATLPGQGNGINSTGQHGGAGRVVVRRKSA